MLLSFPLSRALALVVAFCWCLSATAQQTAPAFPETLTSTSLPASTSLPTGAESLPAPLTQPASLETSGPGNAPSSAPAPTRMVPPEEEGKPPTTLEATEEQPASAPIEQLAPWVSINSLWQTGVLLFGVILVSVLINALNPKQRMRLRRVVILFGLHALFQVLAHTLFSVESMTWGNRLQAVASLFGAYVLVQLLAVLSFSLLLPLLRVEVTTIASELLVGAGYLFATLAVLAGIGLDASGILTTSAVVTAVIGLSLQKTLGNILGGVALQMDKSISVGDWIQIGDGPQGRVVQIRWRHTVVETRNWDTLIIPNSTLLDSTITILGKRDGAPSPHRMWVYFNVDFRYSPTAVIQAVTEALRAAPIPRVASHPPPDCICLDFSRDLQTSMGYYAVRYWLTDLAVDDPTSSEVRERIYFALKRANIPMAIPAQAVFVTREGKEHQSEHWERERQKRLQALRTVDLFRSLSEEELETLADRLRYTPFAKGEAMNRQGTVAHWLYIMAKGSAEVKVRNREGKEETVAHIHAPTFFGEMALLTGEPRSATVIATSEVECYRLDKEAFQKIVSERKGIAEEISNLLAARRVELEAARDHMSTENKEEKLKDQASQILKKIQSFFGLE